MFVMPPQHDQPNQSIKPIIGIAGGIGSGKSTVADILGELGCVVARSDEDARAVLQEPEVREQLLAWWGRAILTDDGELDRRAISRIVFNDPAERKRLEGLTHPRIEARRRRQFADAPADTKAFVIDAPLLYEVGLDRECHAVIFIETPRPVRLERVMEGRGWDEAEFDHRERSQLALDEKRRRAEYVVRNEGNRDALRAAVAAVLKEILERHHAPSID